MRRREREQRERGKRKSSVYMYNVNFSRIRGLCRLFHYYFLFIFLISKETKLLCMEPINCNANDSSQQTNAKRKTTALAKSHHTLTKIRTKWSKQKRSRVLPRHTHVDARIVCVINVCVRTRAHQSGHHFVEGGNNENCTHTHKHTLTDALIKITKRKAPFDSIRIQ